MIERPGFLVIPAYIVGITVVFASVNLVPGVVGVVLAALLILVMTTPFSLFHKVEGLGLLEDGIVWLFALVICAAFAVQYIPGDIGPRANDTFTWWQVAFLVTQQALYFGIHAFGASEH